MKAIIPKKTKILSLFFGGGTPSLLDLNVFEMLMKQLKEYLDLSYLKEFTLEANPISIQSEKLKFYKDQGVSKISLGIQSFTDKHLKTLGRLHSRAQALDSVKRVQEHGFVTSIDLMFGTPKQTLDDWSDNLQIATNLSLDHISLYGLTYEINTLFHQKLKKGLLKKIPDEMYAKFYLTAVDELEQKGMTRYEVSNFSTPQNTSLHNQNYWNHTPYYGLGPGAHSFNGKKRFFNSKKFVEYEKFVLGGCLLTELNHEVITAEILYQEKLMLGLRTVKGFSLPDLKKAYGRSPSAKCLEYWVSKNYLISDSKENYKLINKGWVYLDTITVDCLAHSIYS